MPKLIPELTPQCIVGFWSRVDVRGPDDCWHWIGHANADGYGRFSINHRQYLSHRVAMKIDGREPIGLNAMHRCDNPPCCNPAHLASGTQCDNLTDMAAKGRAARGRVHHNAKLADDAVRAIRIDDRTHKVIAADYGVSRSLIGQIKGGQGWAHVT